MFKVSPNPGLNLTHLRTTRPWSHKIHKHTCITRNCNSYFSSTCSTNMIRGFFFFCFLNITGKSYVAQYISQLSFCNTVVPSRHREQQIYPAILAHIVHQQTRKMFHVKPTLFSFIERTWEEVIWLVATNGILSNFYWTWHDCDMATKVGGLILNNGLSAVPIFLTSLVFPCPGFRAPVFAMSFRGLTNSRGKIGTARSLMTMWKWEYGNDNMEMKCAVRIWKW